MSLDKYFSAFGDFTSFNTRFNWSVESSFTACKAFFRVASSMSEAAFTVKLVCRIFEN